MRRYNLIQPLWMAFYSGDVYADVVQSWRNRTFLYLLLLLAINWIPQSLEVSSRVNAWITTEAPYLIQQMPPITLNNGKASIPNEGVVYVKDRTDSLFMIIDMTGKHTSLNDTGAIVLLTATQLHYRNGPGLEDVQTQGIPPNESTIFTQETLLSLATIINFLIGYGYYPFVIAAAFVLHLAQAFVFATIVSQLTIKTPVSLSRRKLVDLTIMAFTPAVLLDTAHDVLGTPFEMWFWWPICVFLTLGYLFFAIQEVAGAEKEKEQ